jgi:hypothetical protein
VKLAREIIALEKQAPSEQPVAVASAPAAGIVAQSEENLLRRADALAADANKLLATTETLLGSGRINRQTEQAPTPQETQRKIERIYGPQRVEDGMAFVVRANGASNVRLAGDFNDWNPERSQLQRLDADTFHIKLPLSPGRYQYRYVIDGRWENDPANEWIEHNPFGEVNNVVEV